MNEQKFTYEDSELLNEKLSEFFESISFYFCSYCGYEASPREAKLPVDIIKLHEEMEQEIIENSTGNPADQMSTETYWAKLEQKLTKEQHESFKKVRWGHHNSEINNYLTAEEKINLNLFFNDPKHGFFHGLMTSFCSYLLLGSEGFHKSNLSSCLMHDFVKSTHGENATDHDKKLKKYFPNLLPETYEHKNPPNENSNLILADRLELMRYSDYKDWVDDRLDSAYNRLSPQYKRIIKLFYKNVRPALENFYVNKDSIWIRHGAELFNAPNDYDYIDENSTYPFEDSYIQGTSQKGAVVPSCYAIENDSFPFAKFMNYNKRGCKPNLSSLGFCSSHNANYSWGRLKGYITSENFHSVNTMKGQWASIVNSDIRDHLYADSNIKLKNWTFIYDNLNKDFKSKASLVQAANQLDEQKINEELIKILEKLINVEGLGVVNQRNVFYLHLVTKLISQRITLLNLR
jgi:hypothetical protein